MSRQEENYIHFVSSCETLKNSMQILKETKRDMNHPLAGAAFQFALVEYSKPYTTSYGAERNKKGNRKHKFCLGTDFVPDRFKEFHNKIVTARKQLHAHDDLSLKDAKLYVSKTKVGKMVGTIQNNIDPTDKLSRIDEIIEMIDKTLDNMYDEIPILQDELPIKS